MNHLTFAIFSTPRVYLNSIKMVQIRKFAKKETNVGILGLGKSKKGKLGPVVEKKVLPVETNPHILVTHLCGSNLMKEGKDIELKPDNEYPDWLWDLYTGRSKPLEELDPNSKTYWRRLRKIEKAKIMNLSKLKKF